MPTPSRKTSTLFFQASSAYTGKDGAGWILGLRDYLAGGTAELVVGEGASLQAAGDVDLSAGKVELAARDGISVDVKHGGAAALTAGSAAPASAALAMPTRSRPRRCYLLWFGSHGAPMLLILKANSAFHLSSNVTRRTLWTIQVPSGSPMMRSVASRRTPK